MKYNKSEIMKAAWNLYRKVKAGKAAVGNNTFGACLRFAWGDAKNAVEAAEREARRQQEEAENRKRAEAYRQRQAEKAARKFVGVVKIGWGRNTIEVNVYNGDVSGNTYKWRNEIKSCGGQWCPDDRIWSFTPDQAQEFCRKYA